MIDGGPPEDEVRPGRHEVAGEAGVADAPSRFVEDGAAVPGRPGIVRAEGVVGAVVGKAEADAGRGRTGGRRGAQTGSYCSGVRRRREGRSGRRVLRAFPKAISGAKSALSRNRRGTVFQKLLKNEKVSTEVFFLNRYFTCLFP